MTPLDDGTEGESVDGSSVRVRKEWTLKQAKAEQERFVARGGRPVGDPHSPLSQWVAMHELDEEEARFNRGEKYALAMAIRICANHALPLPPWAAAVYIRGFDAVHSFQAESWETIFGSAKWAIFGPPGRQVKRRRLTTIRKQVEKSHVVWQEVRRRHEADKPEAIDDKLFADVGKKIGISATLAKEYYKAEKLYRKAELDSISALLRPYQNPQKK